MMPSLLQSQIDVQRNIWSKYLKETIQNVTELQCAAYTILHETNTIDFFVYHCCEKVTLILVNWYKTTRHLESVGS